MTFPHTWTKSTRALGTKGATMVEYGIIIGLVALAGIAGLSLMGGEVSQTLETADGAIASSVEASRAAAGGSGGAGGAGGAPGNGDEDESSFRWSQNGATQSMQSNGETFGGRFVVPLDGTFDGPAVLSLAVAEHTVSLFHAFDPEFGSERHDPQSVEVCVYQSGMVGEQCYGSSTPALNLDEWSAAVVTVVWPDAPSISHYYEGNMALSLVPSDASTDRQTTTLRIYTTPAM